MVERKELNFDTYLAKIFDLLTMNFPMLMDIPVYSTIFQSYLSVTQAKHCDAHAHINRHGHVDTNRKHAHSAPQAKHCGARARILSRDQKLSD